MIYPIQERNHDFVEACLKVRHDFDTRGQFADLNTIVDIVLSRPARRYYVEYYRARTILARALARGQAPQSVTESNRRMYADMYHDLLAAIRRTPARSLDRIVWDLVTGNIGSPKFYFTRRRALQILRHNHQDL